MKKELNLAIAAHIAYDEQLLKQEVAEHLSLKSTDTFFIKPLRRSIDARSRNIKVNLKLAVWINEPVIDDELGIEYHDVSSAKNSITIIGAGPAGLYAALRCLEIGIKPIVFERGKDVRERRRDLAAINKEHIVNPESNYCSLLIAAKSLRRSLTSFPLSNTMGFMPISKQRKAAYIPAGPAPIIVIDFDEAETS